MVNALLNLDELSAFCFDSFVGVSIEVGSQANIRGIEGREAVTIYIVRYINDRRCETIGRVHLSPRNAHFLAESIETQARATAGIFTTKRKDG